LRATHLLHTVRAIACSPVAEEAVGVGLIRNGVFNVSRNTIITSCCM
jgi:hypothetical protein